MVMPRLANRRADHEARDPERLVSASDTPALSARLAAASAVGFHGCWSEKNVRVEQEVDARERQREREPEQGLGHLVGRVRPERAALVDEAHDRTDSAT